MRKTFLIIFFNPSICSGFYSLNSSPLVIYKPLLLLSDTEQPLGPLISLAQWSQAVNLISLFAQSLASLFQIKCNVQKTQTRPRKKRFPVQFSHKSFPQNSPIFRFHKSSETKKKDIFSLNVTVQFLWTDYFMTKLKQGQLTGYL